MKMKGFELDDYALFHPGGRIGKRLTVRVAEVMLKGEDNPLINISDTMKNCIMRITEKLAGSVSVIDDEGKLMGLITDYDIRRNLEKEKDMLSKTIKEIMNPKPYFVREDAKAFDALTFMQKRERPFNVAPVLDKSDRVVGMLRLQDLVREGL